MARECSQTLACVLGNDVDVDLRRTFEQALDGGVVEIFAEAVDGFSSNDDLGDALFPGEGGNGTGNGLALEEDNLRREIFRKADVGLKTAALLGIKLFAVADMEDKELRVDALGNACATGDELLGGGTGAHADGDAFLHLPVVSEALATEIGIQAAIDGAGNLAEGELAQGHQVATTEEVAESAIGAVLGIDVAALHPGLQGLRREVGHDDLIGTLEHPIGNGFADRDAGDALNGGPEAFNVLDVDGGENVDAGGEQFEHILVAFAVAAAVDVGVGQLVNQDDGGPAGKDGIDIHLLEDGALVLELAAGDAFQLAGELGDAFATVGFNDAGNDVLAATGATLGLAQHAVGFAHAGGVAEKDLEDADSFFFGGLFQPLFGSFLGKTIFFVGGHAQTSILRTILRMRRNGILRWIPYGLGSLAVAGVTGVNFRLLHANLSTVSLSFLLVVLVTAARAGLRPAIVTSLLATLAFNYFFLPPIYTLTVADTRNWVALFAFLTTAMIASQLAERARSQAETANQRRHEVEQLYNLSQQLLITENTTELLTRIPGDITLLFGLEEVALFASSRNRIYRSSGNAMDLPAERLRESAVSRDIRMDGEQVLYAPLMMGMRSTGAMALRGTLPSRETTEALAGLVAIAVERAVALEKLTRAEAARENERLRTALLDSITHDLRTPLTSIKASITSVRQMPNLDVEQREELLAVIEEETDRLNRLIAEAVEMAQLDAREVKLDLQPHPVRAAVEQAMAEVAEALAEHPVEVRIPQSLPLAKMDLAYITKAMHHLLENAIKYSEPGSPIHVSAECEAGVVTVHVADRGAGIDELEQSMIFDKFYRGRSRRGLVSGTGMGLPIVRAILEAHRGTIRCTSQVGHGSVFSFTLPAA